MTAIGAPRPLIFREWAYYFWGLTWLGLVVAGLGIGLWALVPRPYFYDLGSIENFPTTMPAPAPRQVTTPEGKTLWLYIVRREGQWFVFNGAVGCAVIIWLPTNHRFENPCSGFKWTLTGELLTYFISPTPPLFMSDLHDLDQYVASVRDGHLYINANQIIFGQHRLTPPPTLDCAALDIWSKNTLTDCPFKPAAP